MKIYKAASDTCIELGLSKTECGWNIDHTIKSFELSVRWCSV